MTSTGKYQRNLDHRSRAHGRRAIVIAALMISGVVPNGIIAQDGKNGSKRKSLVHETMLHPADAFTGYVFKKGEVAYNQALTPYPSWAWWGITDRVTIELDFECWLGGVPSFNFRVGLLNQKGFFPSTAFETMLQYLNDERDQFHNLDYLEIKRQGTNWYNRINMSWKINDVWHVHLSGGATYADRISISNGDSVNGIGGLFTDCISPDASAGLDCRIKAWLSIHTSASYGSTFLYADNIMRKRQIALAARLAPFITHKYGFFNSFRIEIAFLHADFDDAKESITGPIGFMYWQWNIKHKNRPAYTFYRNNGFIAHDGKFMTRRI